MDCPICMDNVDSTKNCVITECGHCFHTSCLMQNITHNGFGCPYCRTAMVEEDENSTQTTEVDVDDDDTIIQSEPYSNSALQGMRMLFRDAEDDEEDDDDETVNTDYESAEDDPMNISEVIDKFREKYQYDDLVKMICTDYDFRMCNGGNTLDDAFNYMDELHNEFVHRRMPR